MAEYARIQRTLLDRVIETLSALWDCDATVCGVDGGDECERCRTLAELREVK